MKLLLGILIALVAAVGLWLSLNVHNFGIDPLAKVAPGAWQTYTSSTYPFSLQHPPGYIIDESHDYAEMGPGSDIYGVSFTIPPSSVSGTNLSSDTYLSVEYKASAGVCGPELFLAAPQEAGTVTAGGHTYLSASMQGAAVGNEYEEQVYATPVTNGCLGIRYFIHSTDLGNYPSGQVQAFNRAKLIAEFDRIRQSVTINK